jgi:hypothetical protein
MSQIGSATNLWEYFDNKEWENTKIQRIYFGCAQSTCFPGKKLERISKIHKGKFVYMRFSISLCFK